MVLRTDSILLQTPHSSVAAFNYARLSLLFLALQMRAVVSLAPLVSEPGTVSNRGIKHS